MTKWDTEFELADKPELQPAGAPRRATAWALALAVAPLCSFGLSVAFFLANDSRPSQVSELFGYLMIGSIFLAPTVGALLVREGNRRGERWKGWRLLVTVVNILWAVAAILLVFSLMLLGGYSGRNA